MDIKSFNGIDILIVVLVILSIILDILAIAFNNDKCINSMIYLSLIID